MLVYTLKVCKFELQIHNYIHFGTSEVAAAFGSEVPVAVAFGSEVPVAFGSEVPVAFGSEVPVAVAFGSEVAVWTPDTQLYSFWNFSLEKGIEPLIPSAIS